MNQKLHFFLLVVAMHGNVLFGMDGERQPSSPQLIHRTQSAPSFRSPSPQPMSPINRSSSSLEQARQVAAAYKRLLGTFQSIQKSQDEENEKITPLKDIIDAIDNLNAQSKGSGINAYDETLSQFRRTVNQYMNGLFPHSPMQQRRKKAQK